MKRLPIIALILTLLASSLLAAERPIATLTVRNHQALLAAVSRVAEAAKPGMGAASSAMLPAFLGAPQMAGIDPGRPWQAVAWARSGGQGGSLAVYVPVSDFGAFKSGLTPGVLSGGQGENTVAEKGDYAIIFNPNSPGFTDQDRDKALAWKVAPRGETATVNLHFAPSPEIKQMFVGGFRAGREQALQGMMQGLKAAPNNPAFDPATFKELMGLYFRIIDTSLAGFDEFDLGLSVADDDIVITERVTALEGTDLARWFAPNAASVSKDVASIDWNAPIAFAASVRNDPTLSAFFEKAMTLGFRMQGMKQDDEATKDTLKLMKDMLPMVTAGSLSFADSGMNFSGYYRFPDRKADDFYATLLDFMDTTMQKQVGDDKMYKDYDYEKGVRKIGAVSVDRLTMTYNLDNPLFQAPGQKEQINAMFPGGKVGLEYALADGKLFFTMGAAKMEQALKPAQSGKSDVGGLKIGPKTTFAGSMNILEFLKGALQSMPMSPVPPAILNAINPAGTGIRARVDQTGALDAEIRIPLKMIQTVSQAVTAAKAARNN